MTNEEAISRLHTIDGWGEREHEAIAMAIKALEQPPEPCRDAISRQAAIDALKSQLSDWNDDYNIPVRKSIENIERLPSAQPDYQEVLGWLMAYHTMSFDLHGRYLPHEVISWLINDFAKQFIAERGQNG